MTVYDIMVLPSAGKSLEQEEHWQRMDQISGAWLMRHALLGI